MFDMYLPCIQHIFYDLQIKTVNETHWYIRQLRKMRKHVLVFYITLT